MDISKSCRVMAFVFAAGLLGACGGGGSPGASTGTETGTGTDTGTGTGTGTDTGTGTQTSWVTRSVGLTSNNLAAAWNGTQYVVISDAGKVISSTDGVSWNTKSPASGAGPNDVVWGNGLFVSAGADGYINTSPDGTTWTSRNVCSCTDALSAVTWSGSLFTAVGAGGRIYASADGINWTQQASGWVATAQDSFSGIADSSLVRVAVGSTYVDSSPVVRYSNDGTTWQTPTFDVSPTWGFSTVIWDGSRFVITGAGGTYTSVDGAAWTWSGGATYGSGMVWDGTKYLLASTYGAEASTDLVNWTSAFRYYGNHNATDVVLASGLGQYLLIGSGGHTYDGGWLATSPDGANWTVQVGSDPKKDVIWDGSKFMALDILGRVFTSADGLNWSSTVDVSLHNASGLAYSPTMNRYVAASAGSIVSSDDGVTWTTRQLDTALSAQSVIWTGSKFITVGWNGKYLVSADGITWTYKPISGTITPMPYLSDVAWSSSLGLYVAVTDSSSSSIFTSSDETTWNELNAAPPKGLNGIVWTGSQFVAVGNSGTIVTSGDGVNWINRSIFLGPTFYDVQVIFGKVVAVGASGKVFASADEGVTWVEQATDTTNTLYSVSASPTLAVAVGDIGTVISQ